MKVKTTTLPSSMKVSQNLPFESDSGFEMILSEELFQETKNEIELKLDEPINKENFFEFLDKNEKIKNEKIFKKIIFSFGCTEEMKPQIWKFLLNL